MAVPTRKERIARQKRAGRPIAAPAKDSEKSTAVLRTTLGMIVAAVALILYANTLSHDYVLDDIGLITENTQTKRGISAVPEIFQTSYRHGATIADHQLYRPLPKAMFAIEWSLSPGNPQLGHLVNVVTFAALCCLLFLVLSRYIGGDPIIPFITALLFAAHPLHTEVVANIKSRDEILAFLLTLGSLWCFHRYATADSTKHLAWGVFCYFASLLSKESAITLLAVTPLMFHCFLSDTPASDSDGRVPMPDRRRTLGVALAGMAACTGIFLMIRHSVLGNVTTLIPVEDNSLAAIEDILVQRANAIYILGVYLSKMLIPTPLVADASFNTFPPVALTSWKFLLPCTVFMAGLVYAIRNLANRDIVAFCLIYFFVTVSPVSNVIMLIGTNYGERLMFVPSVGICLLLAVVMSRLLKGRGDSPEGEHPTAFFNRHSQAVLVTLGIVVVCGAQTMARNMDWKDNHTLYTTDLQKVPNSVHMLFYLASHLTAEQYLDGLPDSSARMKSRMEAMEYLTRAVTIYPEYAEGFQRRGFVYAQLNDTVRAEADYRRALDINPTHPIVHNNYGTLCFNLRRYDEALDHFQQAVRFSPTYAQALSNLASTYGVFGERDREMITGDPANRNDHIARSRQNFENAIRYFLQSIQADPDVGEPYRSAAVAYRNIGDHVNADEYDRLYQQVMEK